MPASRLCLYKSSCWSNIFSFFDLVPVDPDIAFPLCLSPGVAPPFKNPNAPGIVAPPFPPVDVSESTKLYMELLYPPISLPTHDSGSPLITAAEEEAAAAGGGLFGISLILRSYSQFITSVSVLMGSLSPSITSVGTCFSHFGSCGLEGEGSTQINWNSGAHPVFANSSKNALDHLSLLL